MIGKADWFQRRKYGGWGISPKTWQGWVYVLSILAPFVAFQAMPIWQESTRIIVTIGWLAFLMIDVNHIMFTLNRDEREHKIEAVSERNAAWFMALVLVAGIVYQIISSALNNSLQVNMFMVTALFGGAIVKTISNMYLEKRGV